MIHVAKSRVQQIEYLIEQSIQGNHVLFDHDAMTHVLRDGSGSGLLAPLSEEEAYGVEHHIERLIGEPSLLRKRAYLESLDSRTYAWVVRTYFNIIENNLWESQEVRH
ncbi:MAG: hypothetical protein P4M08_06585 [Oligoflexia bacterium]|nr:hypothetical protein [Oligoflexia bacterium]